MAIDQNILIENLQAQIQMLKLVADNNLEQARLWKKRYEELEEVINAMAGVNQKTIIRVLREASGEALTWQQILSKTTIPIRACKVALHGLTQRGHILTKKSEHGETLYYIPAEAESAA